MGLSSHGAYFLLFTDVRRLTDTSANGEPRLRVFSDGPSSLDTGGIRSAAIASGIPSEIPTVSYISCSRSTVRF